jgi:segregation and condensation protein B
MSEQEEQKNTEVDAVSSEQQAEIAVAVDGAVSDEDTLNESVIEITTSEDAEVEEEESALSDEEIARLPYDRKVALVEALLIAHGEPLPAERIKEVSHLPEDDVDNALLTLKERYDHDASGIELLCIAGEFQIRTRSRFGQFVRGLKASAPKRLSQPALETISIIAYRQPIVKSDIEKIRGVDATPTLKTLVERNLIKIVGHQQTVGQPALYGTSDEFLKLFGLRSLEELPTLRDLKELEKDPGETTEAAA